MKKNKTLIGVLIAVGVVVFLAVAVFVYFIISDIKQEEKLQTEINDITTLMSKENIDYLFCNYSKEEIFELYVNTAYFGNGYYGISQAAKGYYNKSTDNLTLDEASMLAGIPNAPSVYAPTKNLDLAKKRQAQVLKRMVEYNYISQEDANLIINN